MAETKDSAAVVRPPRLPLTDRTARALSFTGNTRIVYDSGPNRQRGFGLRIGQTRKSWIFGYTTAGGRERRMTIGEFPSWSTADARKQAGAMRRLVDTGGDPLGERQAERKSPTFGTLLDDYLDDARTRKRSWRSDRGIVEQYLRPRWEYRKAGSITRVELRELHREISKAGKRTRANRVLAIASAIFGFAIDQEMIEDNPTRGIKRNPEVKRTRYLTPDELARLRGVLRAWPDQVAATAIRLLLLTGCRRGELLGARWGEFDLAAGLWIKPASRTKTKREHRLPLSPVAVAELQRLTRSNSSDFLFPNTANNRHWQQIRDWPAIRAAAGLDDVRLHDQRHTAASMLVSAGNSLPIIGGLLGHSQPSTTARYAHLYDAPIRQAAAQLGQALAPAIAGAD
jgi:integrase